jgi:hypothetical protein
MRSMARRAAGAGATSHSTGDRRPRVCGGMTAAGAPADLDAVPDPERWVDALVIDAPRR